MNVERFYTLTLNEREKDALKKWLGSRNDASGQQAGLSQEENSICSELWNKLPYGDDDEEDD